MGNDYKRKTFALLMLTLTTDYKRITFALLMLTLTFLSSSFSLLGRSFSSLQLSRLKQKQSVFKNGIETWYLVSMWCALIKVLPCLRQHLFSANIASWCSMSADCYIAETIRRVIWILASDTVFANSRNLSTNIETAMPFTASWCSLSPDCYAETAANRLKHCHTLLLLPQILWSVFASLWIWENISIFLLLFSLNKSIKRFRLLQTI